MIRARLVLAQSPERQPSRRIRDLAPGYRAAAEALQIAADHGCDLGLYEALWDLCRREHDGWLSQQQKVRT